jgi:hypothetical protein
MADILAIPVEIYFGSFTVISTTLASVTSPMIAVKVPTTPAVAPTFDMKFSEREI